MSKSFSLDESLIIQLPVAYLGNSEKSIFDNDIVEFGDVRLSFDKFLTLFYNNNYKFFELNEQFSKIDELLIDNKIIKNSKSNTTNKVYLIDIITNKFITNKKMKINDTSKLFFIKDINNYKSLLDFKVYNKFLNFDEIHGIYKQQFNKNNKKYFRFKIYTNYYSDVLDESLTMAFNYLVEIPKNFIQQNYVASVSEEFTHEEVAVAPEENIVYSIYHSNNAEVYDDLENELENEFNDDSVSLSNISLSNISSEDYF